MTDPISDESFIPTVEGKKPPKPPVDLKVVQYELAATATETIGRESEAISDLYEREQENLERLVGSARTELARKYEKYGAKPEDFRLITYYDEKRVADTGGSTVYVVVYGAPNGLDLGDPNKPDDVERSWHNINMSTVELSPEPPRHVVEIGRSEKLRGRAYDDRTGMTAKAYEAFVEAEKAAGGVLPDSEGCLVPYLGFENHTRTLLTGEDYTEDARRGTPTVPIAEVVNGKVFVSTADRSQGASVLRFRPAIELDVHGTAFNSFKPDHPSL